MAALFGTFLFGEELFAGDVSASLIIISGVGGVESAAAFGVISMFQWWPVVGVPAIDANIISIAHLNPEEGEE